MSRMKRWIPVVATVSWFLGATCGQSRAAGQSHPLAPALKLAHSTQKYVMQNVEDFTCVLVKRERIDGMLMRYQYLQMKVRHERASAGRVVSPYSVYLRYLAPKRIAGREVLYVDGWNDGKMRVRKGGGRFSYIKVSVDPMSDAAMGESRYPITEIGIASVIERLIVRIEDDMAADPEAKDTQVRFFKGAKVNGRFCTHICVEHPRALPGLDFFRANVYVDDQLHVPIRIEGYDWPETTDEPPPLLEEYTFTKLRLNVGLSDAEFSPARFQ